VDGFKVSFSSVPGASNYSVSVVARHDSNDVKITQTENSETMVDFY